jgi:hypothetical protein
MADQGLDTYLNDHHAGATAGVNLARMAADEHQQHEHGPFFNELAHEIKTDHDTLEALMEKLGVDKSASKSALAEVGSKLMAPKFTGTEDGLNAFVTCETLSIGVEGKLCMWKALRCVEGEHPAFEDFDLDELMARAQSQRDRIETKRLELAPAALAGQAVSA